MNFKKTVAIAIYEHRTHKTQYLSFFEREIQKAKRDECMEMSEFCNGCILVLSDYKNDIERQYKIDLNENEQSLSTYKRMLLQGKLYDDNKQPIQNHIDRIENEIEHMKDLKLITKFYYKCLIRTDSGEIVKNFLSERLIPVDDETRKPKYEIIELYMNDIEDIESGLLKILKYKDVDDGILLENYNFWNNKNTEVQGRKNIFKGVTEQDFFRMVRTGDFSTVNKPGMYQRVKFNIHVLSRVMGKDWGEEAARKLTTTLEECAKRTDFYESKDLKKMFLQ